jgi:hypothetical protein
LARKWRSSALTTARLEGDSATPCCEGVEFDVRGDASQPTPGVVT